MDARNQNLAKLAIGGLLGYGALRWTTRLMRRMDFEGKTVVITGGSRGLGLLLARRFGSEGARAIIAGRDQEELRRAEDDLHNRGIEATAIPCNVRLQNDCESLIRSAVESYGSVDVLVNCAGIISVGPVELMTEQDYQELMDVHFFGPLHLMKSVYPLMRARGGGRIVNISSIGGKVGVPHLAAYCASKFALAGLSQSCAAELRKDNIYVTTVYPGLMRTGSPRNALFKGRHEQEYTWFTLSDSLPGISQSANRAARRIVNACRYGEPELITSLPAAIGARFHALFPWLSIETSAAINNWALPDAGGIGVARARGYDSETRLTQSPLTALTRAAAEANNEMGSGQT